ncbi:MAG TPA: ABC transporter permease, partial [Bryobacteraceae bacterium]|nr:ABC transporter permease [Bryobacteraceae bacterium]
VEARRLARIALGGPEQVKEACRDARGTRWVEDFARDIRYAVRTLRQRPGFAAIALTTLALGTGATTVMFTLMNTVLLKPLAFRDPGRVMLVQEQTNWTTPQGNLWRFSYPNYVDAKRAVSSLELATWMLKPGTVSAPGAAEYIDGLAVSGNMFSMLGLKVAHGRGFLPEEDRVGAAPVAIISQALSRRQFGEGAKAVGARLTFDNKPYTVVGVLPPGFRLDNWEYDVYTPVGQETLPAMENRDLHWFGVWGRLKAGVSLAAARSELTVVGRRLEQEYPKSNRGRTFIAEPLRPFVGDARSTLWLLAGAVSLVLLIACANIASLLLARALSRERELTMRAALGAGRGRLARQCLTESCVLALAGGGLGVLLAAASVPSFVAFWPGGLPRAEGIQLDWRVLLFAAGVAVASGLLFGLAPALRTPSQSLEQALRAGSRTVAGGARRMHRAFVIAEIAIAMVLLASAGILGRTLLRLASLDSGVNLHNVLTARIALSPATLENPDATREAWRDLLDRGRRVPGVEAIAAVDTVPMREGSNIIGYSLSGAPAMDEKTPMVLANSVTPDYLKATGIVLRRGRFITDADRKGGEPVAVIDDVMAREAFGSDDPIGKRIWMGLGTAPRTVIGVVDHVRQWGLAADDQSTVRAQLYYPFAQVPDPLVRRWSELMSIAVRTSVDPLTVVEPLRAQVRGAGGDQVVYEIRTFEELAKASLARQRFLLVLFGAFAGLALLLASIGIYGVLAYLTSQRVPEIGVRMALGASATEVRWMVLRQSLVMTLSGVGVGILGAIAAGRVLMRLVEGVRSIEPIAFAAMIAVLVVAALAASFVPAHRASRVDPMKALRQE